MIAQTFLDQPEVAHYLRYSARTDGCNKVLRTCQYTCRFILGLRQNTKSASQITASLAAVKSQLGLVRKWLSAGRFVEHFLMAAALYAKKPSEGMDQVLRWLNIGRQLGFGVYLSLDSVTYIDLIVPESPVPSVTAKRLQRASVKAWLTALSCSIAAGLYGLRELSRRSVTADKLREDSSKKDLIKSQKSEAKLQLLSDFSDLIVATSVLRYHNFDDTVVGFAGIVSGVIGAWKIWQKTAL